MQPRILCSKIQPSINVLPSLLGLQTDRYEALQQLEVNSKPKEGRKQDGREVGGHGVHPSPWLHQEHRRSDAKDHVEHELRVAGVPDHWKGIYRASQNSVG